MKSNKIMAIIQTILMYVAHIPVYIGLVLFYTNIDDYMSAIMILLLVGIILTLS